MKKCPRCHKDIPEDVEKCPYCGYKMGYENKNREIKVQPPTPRASMLRRIIFYSLIAGLVFGPRFYNSFNNGGRGTVVIQGDNQYGEGQFPVTLYANTADFLTDYPDSDIVTKLESFEADFYSFVSNLGSTPLDTTYQFIVSNSEDVYVYSKYLFEIRGEAMQVTTHMDTYDEAYDVDVKYTRFDITDFTELSLATADYSDFFEVMNYLGDFGATLVDEASGALATLLESSDPEQFVGHYGQGTTLHNNGSTFKVYYGNDTVTANDDAIRYFESLEFNAILKDGLIETL